MKNIYFKSKRQEKDFDFIYNLIWFNTQMIKNAFNGNIIISLENKEHNLFLNYAKEQNLKLIKNVYIISKNTTYVIARKSFVIS